MFAAMAQLVERVLGKDEVGGSNPPSSSKEHPQKVFFSFYLQTADRGRADARRLAIPSHCSLQIRLVAPKYTHKRCSFLFTYKPSTEVGLTLAGSLFRRFHFI